MLDLNSFRYFVEVVDRGSFAAAARALQQPISTMSYRIQQLEKGLGLTLLTRTPRRLAMTQAGKEFYGCAKAMVESANEAEAIMRDRSTEPVGTIHYTVATSVAQFAMTDMLLSFLREHPRVAVVQSAADEMLDILGDGYDLAVRAHSDALPDSRLVQRPLATVPWHLFATPGYFDRADRPVDPGDLDRHDMLLMKRGSLEPFLDLRAAGNTGQAMRVRPRPRIVANCVATLKRAAGAGMGIVALPAYVCRDEVRSGHFERVLPGWTAGSSTITALIPDRRGITAATRAFVDHIAAALPAAVRVAEDTPGA